MEAFLSLSFAGESILHNSPRIVIPGAMPKTNLENKKPAESLWKNPKTFGGLS